MQLYYRSIKIQCNTALKSSLGFKLVFSGITVILLQLGHDVPDISGQLFRGQIYIKLLLGWNNWRLHVSVRIIMNYRDIFNSNSNKNWDRNANKLKINKTNIINSFNGRWKQWRSIMFPEFLSLPSRCYFRPIRIIQFGTCYALYESYYLIKFFFKIFWKLQANKNNIWSLLSKSFSLTVNIRQ